MSTYITYGILSVGMLFVGKVLMSANTTLLTFQYGLVMLMCYICSVWVKILLLQEPPQRRKGPDLVPLWLLVGTPSAVEPELASKRAEHSLSYSDVTIYIFAIQYLSSMLYVYRFYDLSAWGGCWFVVYIRRFIYNLLKVCPFDYTAGEGSGKVWPVNKLTTPIWWP